MLRKQKLPQESVLVSLSFNVPGDIRGANRSAYLHLIGRVTGLIGRGPWHSTCCRYHSGVPKDIVGHDATALSDLDR